MEAAKVKNKLQGAILKGSKVRIEKARPRKRKLEAEGVEVDNDTAVAVQKPAKQAKKEQKLHNIHAPSAAIPGIELDKGRSVKRGWTEGKEKRSRGDKSATKEGKEERSKNQTEKSKYTHEPEILFRTKIPPNKQMNAGSTDQGKFKSKSKKRRPDGVVVHEFEKTQKHASFLKTTPPKSLPSQEFVEGKGWIDSRGTVIEAVKTVKDLSRAAKEGSSFGMQSADVESKIAVQDNSPPIEDANQSTSTSLRSSTISSDSDSSSGEESSQKSDVDIIESLADEPGAAASELHPLEALFKRKPQGQDNRPSPITTSFSFFKEDANNKSDEENDVTMSIVDDGPQTPFAQHVNARNISRSGAPTPDTAAVHRRFSFTRGAVDADVDLDVPTSRSAENDNEGGTDRKMADMLSPVNEGYDEEGNDDDFTAAASNGQQEESAFATWFWQNRGDNNRKWKARRKEAMKEKRQRETRRLGRRIL